MLTLLRVLDRDVSHLRSVAWARSAIALHFAGVVIKIVDCKYV